MFRTAAILGGWVVAASGVLYMLFAPTGGIVQAGPAALIGMALLGAGIARQAHTEETAACVATQPTRSRRR